MRAAFDVGDEVIAVKALRNDGTYPEPDIAVGDVLVDAGSSGHVRGVGLYLQEHIVYAVAFTNGRVVGCLEKELVPATAAVHHEVAAPHEGAAHHEGGDAA